MGRPRVLTGARAILKMVSKSEEILAFAAGVSYNIDHGWKEIYTVDNSLPSELAPGKIKVEIKCDIVRVPYQSPAWKLLQSTMWNELEQPYIRVEILDRLTGERLLVVPRAVITKRIGKVNAKKIAVETWTLIGIGWHDEMVPDAPPNPRKSLFTENGPRQPLKGKANAAGKTPNTKPLGETSKPGSDGAPCPMLDQILAALAAQKDLSQTKKLLGQTWFNNTPFQENVYNISKL